MRIRRGDPGELHRCEMCTDSAKCALVFVRVQYSFPPDLTNTDRRYIHTCCKNLNLTSKSTGGGKGSASRYVVVYKGVEDKKQRKAERKHPLSVLNFHSQQSEQLVDGFLDAFPLPAMAAATQLDDTELDLKALAARYIPNKSNQDMKALSAHLQQLYTTRNAARVAAASNGAQTPLQAFRTKLPIYAQKDTILQMIDENQVLVLSSSTGSGKCWGAGTQLMMFDGSTRAVEKVVEGDLLMGDDSTPRQVCAGSLNRGNTANDAAIAAALPHHHAPPRMPATYRITSANAANQSWTCNGDHILVLRNAQTSYVEEMSVNEFMQLDEETKSHCHMFMPGVVHFAALPDRSLQDRLAGLMGAEASAVLVNDTARMIGTWLTQASPNHQQHQHLLHNLLESYDMLQNKHLPRDLVTESVEVRMAILDGVMDGNGGGAGEVRATQRHLIEQIAFLSRSLGCRTSKIMQDSVCSFGITVTRREIDSDEQCCESFKVEEVAHADYFGFTLQAPGGGKCNGRLLMADFTVTHNSTQVPQYLLDHLDAQGRGAQTDMIVTQPRRISAMSLAQRVAQEREVAGEQLGDTVGYQIRLENCRSSKTRLLYCTIGVLLRRLSGDRLLQGVSHIIVDEVHEREKACDFLLIILKDILTVRKDLKLIL